MKQWRWYLVAGLILAAALFIQSGLLAYAMYVLLGLLILGRLMAKAWTENLSATRRCKVHVAEIKDVAAVHVTLINSGWLTVPWVLIEDILPRWALSSRLPRLRVQGKRVQVRMLPIGKEISVNYKLECLQRGYFQIGPMVLESGDLFGLHRRYRAVTEPHFLLVLPRVVPLEGWDLASRRPVGEVRLTHRLFEDPTRVAGVRPFEHGDPLNRVHWRATARTGALHSKVYEPSTLAGATLILDFHKDGYPRQGEPFRSELAVTATVSLVNAVCEIGQKVGLVTNARDAADRIRLEGWDTDYRTRQAAKQELTRENKSDRLQPLIVETRRDVGQLQRIREQLARVELTDGLPFHELMIEASNRVPRDSTIVAVLPDVPIETAVTLGNLRRQGYAVTVILIMMDGGKLEKGHARLLAEGIRDVRHLRDEKGLQVLCLQQVQRITPYVMTVE